MKSYRDFFLILVGLYHALQDRLTSIDGEASVIKYGEPVRKIRRLEILDKWAVEALARFQIFWSTEAPAIAKANAQEATRVLTSIARGIPSDVKTQSARPPEMMTTHEALLWSEQKKQTEAITTRLDTLIFLQQVAVAAVANDRCSTASLEERCSEYETDARTGDTFDYVAFAIDRVSLPAILRWRAEEDGDGRAVFALEKLAKTETALVQRAVPDYDPNAEKSAEIEDLKHIQRLIENLAANQENYKPFADFMSMVSRTVERKPQPVAPLVISVPKQRSAQIEAEIRRIAAARANANAVTAVGFSK